MDEDRNVIGRILATLFLSAVKEKEIHSTLVLCKSKHKETIPVITSLVVDD